MIGFHYKKGAKSMEINSKCLFKGLHASFYNCTHFDNFILESKPLNRNFIYEALQQCIDNPKIVLTIGKWTTFSNTLDYKIALIYFICSNFFVF